MKKKITGIFVCLLVVAVASLLVAETVTVRPDRETAASLREAKETANYTPVEGVAEEILAGPVDRTKDFCNLYGSSAFYINNWFYGLEWYANYQDPEEFGCVDVWPFKVTEICFDMRVSDSLTFEVQGFVLENVGQPDCPLPGDTLCQTPIYQIDLPDSGRFQIGLPMIEQCCVNEPYFAAIYIHTNFSSMADKPDALCEDDSTDTCRSYNDYGFGWQDLVVYYGWSGEMILNSVGYTSPQNDCNLNPPECTCIVPCSVVVHLEDAMFEFHAVDPDSNVHLTHLLQTVGSAPAIAPFVIITDDDPGYLAGIIVWTPECTVDQWTWYHFELKVTDGEYWDTCHFYALCYNEPPWVVCPPNEEIHDYDTYVGNFTYGDPEDDDVVDIWLDIQPDPPTNADPVLDYADGIGTVTWTPNSEDTGTTYDIVLTAIDQCWDLGPPCPFDLTVTENPWQNHKMHYPQLPDLDETGMDVEFPGDLLGDDWMCTQTGPVTDIHIWGSFEDDILPGGGPGDLLFGIFIMSDIPGPPSTPGPILWTKTFYPGSYVVNQVADNNPEDWYDPLAGSWIDNDHLNAYQYDFFIEHNFFVQDSGTVYWLAIPRPSGPGYTFGWKTTEYDRRYRDDAVYYYGVSWIPMSYPPGHEYADSSLDLAFVITGEEPTLCGDVNNDGTVGLGDVVYFISYQYKNGAAPVPCLCVGDVNNDDEVALGDVVYLISFQYKNGAAPSPNCCNPPWGCK